MRRLAILCAAVLVVLSSCGATLRMHATAPTFDNDGTCTSPVLIAAPVSIPRMLHFSWTGPLSGEDSVATSSGVLVTLTRTVPPGVYVVRAWASDAGGAGCDTSITTILKAPPWKVSL